MDESGWEQRRSCLSARAELPRRPARSGSRAASDPADFDVSRPYLVRNGDLMARVDPPRVAAVEARRVDRLIARLRFGVQRVGWRHAAAAVVVRPLQRLLQA